MKTVLAIPVFDNPATIARVMQTCLTIHDLPLIVVDDGSEIPVEQLVVDNPVIMDAVTSGRCRIFRHEKNTGKGTALKTAFRLAKDLGYSHVLTLDGDGQHFPEDLLPILENAGSDEIIIGARQMNAENSPLLSRMGRAIADFWIELITKQPVHDSQSGVRLYPIHRLSEVSRFGEHYDFEMEVLIHLLWLGVRPRSVDIRVYYPVSSLHVSHFNKFRDNYRIVVANLKMFSKR